MNSPPQERSGGFKHRLIVAWGFRIAGLLLGAPSLLALAVICINLPHAPPPNHSSYLAIGTYGIAGLLANAAHGAGAAFDWLEHVGAWVAKLLAFACVVILLCAASLYLAGRGIARGSPAARAGGFALSLLCLLFSVTLLLVLPSRIMAMPIFGCGLSLYALWVLGWRYNGARERRSFVQDKRAAC